MREHREIFEFVDGVGGYECRSRPKKVKYDLIQRPQIIGRVNIGAGLVGRRSTFRFAVHNSETGLVSTVWSVTVQGEDVFIFCRALGHRVKGTIHSETGQCHLKYDKHFAEANKDVLPKWLVDKWFYEKIGPWVEPFRIVFPREVVDSPASKLPKGKKIELLPVEQDSDATFIRFVIVAPDTEIVREPELIHNFADGSRFCLAVTHGTMPNLHLPETTPVRLFSGVTPADIDESEKLRGIVLADDGDTKCLFNVQVRKNFPSD